MPKKPTMTLDELKGLVDKPLMFTDMEVRRKSGKVQRLLYFYKGLYILDATEDSVEVIEESEMDWKFKDEDVPVAIVVGVEHISMLDIVVARYKTINAEVNDK